MRPSSPGQSAPVKVWRIQLDQIAASIRADWELLAPTERAAAGRFRFDVHRHRFIARRAARRRILGQFLAVDPATLGFTEGPYGQPFLSGPHGGLVHFSSSANGDLALLGVSETGPIGLDLEAHQSVSGDLVAMACYFAPEEQAALARLPSEVQSASFFDCWTRKEAFVKALGLGLSVRLDRFAVTVDPVQPAALVRVDEALGAIEDWDLLQLDLGVGYSATLVGPPGTNAWLRSWPE